MFLLLPQAQIRIMDCFASTNWNMFLDSSNGIEEYTTSVNGFINKCIDNIIPTVTVRTYPNQKQWITGNIRTELNTRAAIFKSGRLIRTLIRNPAMPSDEPSSRQSINTGLRLVIVLDGLPGQVLRACMDQLASVFTGIFNLSLQVTHASSRPT